MTAAGQHVVFLDRDGTLIETEVVDGRPVPRHEAVAPQLLPGVRDGCARLRAAGLHLVMVTNQPDVARGTVDVATVTAHNDCLVAALGLDLALSCFHDDGDGCDCRKPEPGLLVRGAHALGTSLDRSSCIIGDRWRDVDAGKKAGVTAILLERGYDEQLRAQPDHVATSFTDAVDWILGSMHKGEM